MEIDTIIDRIGDLPDRSREKLTGAITEEQYPKGALLLKSNRVERNIYFVKKGIVRAYIHTPDEEITFWFGREGDTIVSMRSYVENREGYENVELLEDSLLYKLDVTELHRFFATDIHIANWGRKFAEQELLKTEKRLIARQFSTATERYEELITKKPELLQRVQLSYIASYLGITQVSLSRIRSKIK